MKEKRIFKRLSSFSMRLNIYTSPLLAFVFVFIGEFVAYTLYGISLLALIGLARKFWRGWSKSCNLLADLASELDG